MVSKGIFVAMAIVIVLVIGGGIYMTQQPPSTPLTTPTTPTPAATTPAETPTLTETPTSPVTPTPAETPEETLSGPTLPMGTDEEQVEALVMAYCNAFDRNSAEEVAGCFMEKGVYASTFIKIPTCSGHENIKKNFQAFFDEYPGVVRENLQIQQIEVSGDSAQVIMNYNLSEGSPNPSEDETLTIVRVDGTWRIEKSFHQYGH